MVATRVPTRDTAPGVGADVVSSLAGLRVKGNSNILPGLDLEVERVGDYLSAVGNDDRRLAAECDLLQSLGMNRAGACWSIRESDSHSADWQVRRAEHIREPEPDGFSRN